MQKCKLVISCLTLLSILLFARCTEEKTEPKQPEPLPDFEAIDNAKEWFSGQTGGHVSVPVDSKTKSSGTKPESVQLYGEWGESQTEDLGDIKNVEVPVFKLHNNPDSTDEDCTSCLKSGSEGNAGRSHTRFVVQTDEETGKTRGFMMTVIPTEEYLASGKDIEHIDYYNRGDDFCGLIVFNHLDGSFANAWKYKEGEIVHGYIRKKRNIAQNKLKAMAKIEYTWCSQVKVETETYTYYNDKECWTSYEYIYYHQYQRNYFNSNFDSRISGGGGSSSQENDQEGIFLPYDPIKKIPLTIAISESLNLDFSQSLLLEEALLELTEICSDNHIYNKFVSKGQKFNFEMDSGLKHPAGYDPSSKTFKFRDNDAITFGKLKEEFFHAFQDFFYSGGISQYTTTGKVNIEFEAKLYQDIVNVGCCLAFNMVSAPKKIKENYLDWIIQLRKNPSNLTNADYQQWLKLFNTYTSSYSSPLASSLSSPDALQSILLNSKCY